MCGEVGYTSNRVTLNFDIWRHHLPNKRRQSTEANNVDFVLSYLWLVDCLIPCFHTHTIDCKIAEGSTRRPLYFDVGVLKKEQNRLEGFSVDLSDIYFALALNLTISDCTYRVP